MNDISIALICTIISVACTMLGAVLGYRTFKKTAEKEVKVETKESSQNDMKVKMQLDYISKGVDDIKLDLKVQDKRISEIVERVAKVEVSANTANHRLDILEKERNE